MISLTRLHGRSYEIAWGEVLESHINTVFTKDPSKKDSYQEFIKKEYKEILETNLKEIEKKFKSDQTWGCPKCGSGSYNERTTLKPRYRCSKCKHEFSQLKKKPKKKYMEKRDEITKLLEDIKENKPMIPSRIVHYAHRKALNHYIHQFIPSCFEELVKNYEAKIQELLDNYNDFSKVLVLCKGCHYAAERGMELCQKCKEHYKQPRYETCYQCKLREEEADDPLAREIRKAFNISKKNAEESRVIGLCINCGAENWELEGKTYNMYLDVNGKKEYVGFLCEECYEILKEKITKFSVELSLGTEI